MLFLDFFIIIFIFRFNQIPGMKATNFVNLL